MCCIPRISSQLFCRCKGNMATRGSRVEEAIADMWDYRVDDKTATEYNLTGGATLHLVLALRGGC